MPIVVIMTALLSGPVLPVAQGATPASGPTSRPADLLPPEPEEIPSLLAMLGHPSYKVREEATARLKLVSREKLTDPLAKLYRSTADYEVKLRAKEIAQTVFLKEHEEGFLGVALELKLLTHADDPRLKDDAAGIKINHVFPDSAAHEAGLRLNDIIIGCGGKGLPRGNDDDATQGFRAMIASKRPGTHVRLDVLRGHQLLKIDVTLRARPENLWVGEKQAQLERIEKALQAWWRENFEQAAPLPHSQ